MSTATKKAKAPVKTSDRKRPNKAFISQMAAFRGFMTGNEKTQLATLDVKNIMQRVNNRAMSDNVNDNFNGADNERIQKLIKQFVKDIDAVISGK
jgi:LPS O-antigen subunit length determinant protein (WzzB/FepE family)